MYQKLAGCLAVACVAALSTAASAAPLVTNGGFESGPSSNAEFGLAGGGQTVAGWTGNNGYNLYFTSAAASTTVNASGQYSYTGKEKLWGPVTASPNGGGAFVALDGDTAPGVQGGISQLINGLFVGGTYKLTFDWGAGQLQSRSGATTEQLQVTFGSDVAKTAVVSDLSESYSGWKSATFTFIASSTSELLSFLSLGTPNGLPPIATLDNVSLVQVPEPASMAMLGMGVAGLVALRRRRRAV